MTVNDTQPPTITCPANVSAPAGDLTGGIVNYPAPIASDNCPGVVSGAIPASGSSFPLGTTTVVGNATDTTGNASICGFTVAVSAPTIAVPALSGGALLLLGVGLAGLGVWSLGRAKS